MPRLPLHVRTLFVALVLTACGRESAAVPTTSPAAAPAPVAQVSSERISKSAGEPGVWLSTGRDYSEQRFSPLTQITAQNVKDLGLDWSFKLDIDRGVEATPLVVDGVMYLTGAYSIVYALDARNGALKWRFDPQVPRTKAGYACCDVVNRGVALRNGRLYVGSFDGRLIALNARDGTKVWEVDTIEDSQRSYSITGAPLVVGDLVLIGNGGAEYGVRGYLSAYDAESGALRWRFHTVPGDPDKPSTDRAMQIARPTWKGDKLLETGGGGTVWNTIAHDPELDLIYFGTGNGVPWDRAARGEINGDNLFLSSIVALKAKTGEYAWHYQQTPGDMWDYDSCSNIVLADLQIDGAPRKVLLHAPKNGFFYVVDRITGKLLSAEKFVTANWATHVDLKSGRPAIDEDAAVWSKGPKLVSPGPIGAHNWQPMSFSPQTGLTYIPAHESFALLGPVADATFNTRPGTWNIAVESPTPEDPKQLRQVSDAYKGRLIAWDPVRQKAAWSVDLPHVWNGGTLATAGNLVFQGTADGRFVAYAADTGQQVWETPANSGVMAGAMSYELDGQQYVTVLAGWGGGYPLFLGALATYAKVKPEARVLTYKFGGKAVLPVPKRDPVPAPTPPAQDESKPETAKTIQAGRVLFARHCANCHGISAISGGVLPDLRYLTAEKHAMFAPIVAGARANEGMPSFAGLLGAEDVDALHQYVIKRSHDLQAELARQHAP